VTVRRTLFLDVLGRHAAKTTREHVEKGRKVVVDRFAVESEAVGRVGRVVRDLSAPAREDVVGAPEKVLADGGEQGRALFALIVDRGHHEDGIPRRGLAGQPHLACGDGGRRLRKRPRRTTPL
jgi:hypothetical protein